MLTIAVAFACIHYTAGSDGCQPGAKAKRAPPFGDAPLVPFGTDQSDNALEKFTDQAPAGAAMVMPLASML